MEVVLVYVAESLHGLGGQVVPVLCSFHFDCWEFWVCLSAGGRDNAYGYCVCVLDY